MTFTFLCFMLNKCACSYIYYGGSYDHYLLLPTFSFIVLFAPVTYVLGCHCLLGKSLSTTTFLGGR